MSLNQNWDKLRLVKYDVYRLEAYSFKYPLGTTVQKLNFQQRISPYTSPLTRAFNGLKKNQLIN